MSLLDRAIDFAQKAYNYVVGNDNESNSASNNVKKAKVANNNSSAKTTQTKVNSCVNPTETLVGNNIDTVEINKDNKAVKPETGTKPAESAKVQTNKNNDKYYKKYAQKVRNKSIQTLIEDVKTRIMQKCKKFGISYEEAEATILSQMQFSYAEFKGLTPEEQLANLCAIDCALGLYIIDKGKRRVHKDADKAAVIGETARNIKQAKDVGAIDEVEEFEEHVGNINEELEDKIDDITDEDEYATVLQESRRAFRASVEIERVAEIKKCNGDKAKIAEVNKKYDARLRIFERQRQLEFAAARGPQKAAMSIYLRGADDYAEAHEVALCAFSGNTRTIVADSFDHNFEMNARRRYYESGEPVSSEQYAKAIEYTTQYMSQKALTKFQNDAYSFRKKVENGEISAPYMTEEDFTKETVAIGVGITNNNNMSTADKAELLNKWDKNAQQFSDYCKVKEDFNKAVYICAEGNSNKVQGLINLKKILAEKYNNNIERLPRVWEKRKKQNPVSKIKADETVLKDELKSKTVSEIKNNYNNSMHEIAKIILKNDVQYKNRIDDILDYLKCFSGTDIGIKITGCSTRTISKIIMAFPEKADDILNVVAPTMCFTGKQAVERIVQEGNRDVA